MKPDVTVVIPVYNEGEAIMPCLDRILRGGDACPARCWSSTTCPTTPRCRTSRRRPGGLRGSRGVLNVLRARPGERDPVRLRRGAVAGRPWSRWPTAATTRGRSTSWPGWWNGGSWSPPHRGTCRAASRWAGRGSSAAVPHRGQVTAPVGPGRHPGRHQQLQGLLHRLRPAGRHRHRGRLRDRPGAHREGHPAAAAGAEIPTIWLDRSLGESRFDVVRWLPATCTGTGSRSARAAPDQDWPRAAGPTED